MDIDHNTAYPRTVLHSPCPDWHYCGDVNGSCSYNGLDITYGVAFFKGGPLPIPCGDCPPNTLTE